MNVNSSSHTQSKEHKVDENSQKWSTHKKQVYVLIATKNLKKRCHSKFTITHYIPLFTFKQKMIQNCPKFTMATASYGRICVQSKPHERKYCVTMVIWIGVWKLRTSIRILFEYFQSKKSSPVLKRLATYQMHEFWRIIPIYRFDNARIFQQNQHWISILYATHYTNLSYFTHTKYSQ